MGTRYRILGPDEVIQEGDEISEDGNTWSRCLYSVGETPDGWKVRRLIHSPDPLVAELVEAFTAFLKAHDETVLGEWGNVDLNKFNTERKAAVEALEKARSTLKTYETVDEKAIQQK